MAGPQEANASVDSIAVGESWIQRNRDNFAISKIPRVAARDEDSGVDNTSYKLAALDNFMSKGLPEKWRPGQSLGSSRRLKEVDVQFAPEGYHTNSIGRVERNGVRYRFSDLENNIVPGRLSEAWQGQDKLLNYFLDNGFGAEIAFTNGGGALDDPSDYANQAPDKDIQEVARPFRKYASPGERMLVGMIDVQALDVLARHPVYTGAGTGSAIATQLPVDQFLMRFMSIHRFPLIPLGVVSDAALLGQAADISYIHAGRFWIGLIDPRSEWPEREDGSPGGPDGAIAYGDARTPEVVDWMQPGSEMREFEGRYSLEIYNPRGNEIQLGNNMKKEGAGGIFTTLPT